MFVSVEEALNQLSESEQKQLERITDGIDSSPLVDAKIDPETGNIRYLDGNDGSLLLEVEGALID